MTFNKCSIKGKSYGDPRTIEGSPLTLTEVSLLRIYTTVCYVLSVHINTKKYIYLLKTYRVSSLFSDVMRVPIYGVCHRVPYHVGE